MEEETRIPLREGEEFIRLSQAMKKAGLVMNGAEAKMRIRLGEVSVNSEAEDRPGRKLFPGDSFVYGKKEYTIA